MDSFIHGIRFFQFVDTRAGTITVELCDQRLWIKTVMKNKITVITVKKIYTFANEQMTEDGTAGHSCS